MRRGVTCAVYVLLHLILFRGAAALRAQDTRNVVEPHLPPLCTVLTARLSATGGILAEASERTSDTARIQEAIDHCPHGRAVELKADGSKNIFLFGPLPLKTGVKTNGVRHRPNVAA
jgi:polygalacturonase